MQSLLSSLLLGPFLSDAETAILGIVFLAALARYTGVLKRFPRWGSYSALAGFTVAVRLAFAAVAAAGQYYVWSAHPFTRHMLETPLNRSIFAPMLGWFFPLFDNRLGYFLFYSWGHFFLEVLLSVVAAWLLYLFLKSLQRYRGRFFAEGEVMLCFLLSLVVGWPGVVLLVPFGFLSMVAVSAFRFVVSKGKYTTIGVPFIIAAGVVFIWGEFLLDVLHLTVLRVAA
jgi:hypothetical protein